MSKSQIDLTQGPLIRKLAILAAPLVAGNVLQTIYNLVDMFWVGRLGANAVAAVAIVFPTQWLLISMAMGVTIAGAALVSQWTGAGRPDMAGFATAQTIVLATTISTTLAAIAFAGRYLLLAFLGASGGLYQPTLDYVSVIFWSVPFTFLFMAFTASLQGSGDTVRPMYLAIASNLINVVLDPLLIFGVGPFPAFGVAGAAWATLIARAVAGLVGLALLFSGSLAIHIKVSQLAPDRETMRRLLKIAIPGGVDGAARQLFSRGHGGDCHTLWADYNRCLRNWRARDVAGVVCIGRHRSVRGHRRRSEFGRKPTATNQKRGLGWHRRHFSVDWGYRTDCYAVCPGDCRDLRAGPGGDCRRQPLSTHFRLGVCLFGRADGDSGRVPRRRAHQLFYDLVNSQPVGIAHATGRLPRLGSRFGAQPGFGGPIFLPTRPPLHSAWPGSGGASGNKR